MSFDVKLPVWMPDYLHPAKSWALQTTPAARCASKTTLLSATFSPSNTLLQAAHFRYRTTLGMAFLPSSIFTLQERIWQGFSCLLGRQIDDACIHSNYFHHHLRELPQHVPIPEFFVCRVFNIYLSFACRLFVKKIYIVQCVITNIGLHLRAQDVH